MTRVVPVNSEAVLEDTGVSQGMCLPAQGSLYIALRGGKRGEEVAAGRFEETVGLPHDTAHRNITEGGKKEIRVTSSSFPDASPGNSHYIGGRMESIAQRGVDSPGIRLMCIGLR
eukprot:GGOE01010053.1.p3 GENE.GGOE01010053.1~~GGOE01010053.1.p3  ORF type:complete len:115 (-),score=6.58 GGOE01010053.1:195-539(-)